MVTIVISVLEGMLQRPVTVTLNTLDGSATSVAPIDFISLLGVVLQFDENTQSNSVTVTIIDDDIVENVEDFFAALMTTDSAVDLAPNMTTVNIIDLDDGKPLANYFLLSMHIMRHIYVFA